MEAANERRLRVLHARLRELLSDGKGGYNMNDDEAVISFAIETSVVAEQLEELVGREQFQLILKGDRSVLQKVIDDDKDN